MTECSELTDQIVNSLVVTLFLLGGWMLSVYGQADPEMFDSNDDIWSFTVHDSDGSGGITDGDHISVEGSLLDNELQRAAFLLKVKAFAGAIFLFSACMIAQRYTPKSS